MGASDEVRFVLYITPFLKKGEKTSTEKPSHLLVNFIKSLCSLINNLVQNSHSGSYLPDNYQLIILDLEIQFAGS